MENTTPNKATIIHPDNTESTVEPRNKMRGYFSLNELEKIVGGMVDIIDLGNNKLLVVNDGGSALDLPINSRATELAVRVQPTRSHITGTALLATRVTVK